MFRLAVRGVPNFGHIAYMDVNSFADVHARFSVKITPSFIEPGMAAFRDTEGRKVFLYILPEEHDADNEARRRIAEKFNVEPWQL